MNYPSIRIEGAILSPDILERLEDAAGQQAADFGFDRNAKVKDEIARAWAARRTTGASSSANLKRSDRIPLPPLKHASNG